MKNNLIICGEGHGIECVYRGLINHNQVFILCTEDVDLKRRAIADGIQVVRHYSDAINDEKDIVLTAAYKPKIAIDDLKRARFLNIHYALLPKYRGMHAIVWAILNGESHVGFTLHQTAELLDQGPVIYQESVPVADKTSWDLMMIIDNLVAEKIFGILGRYCSGELLPNLQNENDAIYVAPRNQEDCKVCWDRWSAEFFSRALKALVKPYPVPFFEYKNNRIEILRASVIHKDYLEINGHLVYIDNYGIYVKIPNGLLYVNEIRIDGNTVDANKYFKKIGARFK